MGKSNKGRPAVVALACVGVFVAYLPVVTVAVSLPAIQRALHASTGQLAWIQDAFVLPMAALILTAGVLGDIHGRRRVYLAGLGLCAAGAVAALCAGSVQMLWTGQALAGAGAAALLPVTLGLISHAVPDHQRRGKYIGIWTTCMMGAMVVGPLVAGPVVTHLGWRWIYVLPLVCALIALATAARLLPDSRSPHARRPDVPGQVTAAVAITALVYGVIEGGEAGFSHPASFLALVLAAVAVAAFVVVERRSASPMLDLTLFRSRGFTASALVAAVSFLGLIGFFFVLSLYLGIVQRLGTTEAALRVILVNLVSMTLGLAAGRIMRHVRPRVLITTGLLVAAAALATMLGLEADTSYLALAWRLALLGLGLGLVMPCITAVAVSSVPPHQAGMAGTGNNAFRQVGSALGPALLGTLLASRAVDSLPGRMDEAGVAASAARRAVEAAREDGVGAVAGLDLGPDTGRAMDALSAAFLDGLRLCLTVSSTLLVVAALAAAVLLRPRRAPAAGGPAVAAGAPGSTAETGSEASTAPASAH
ncbi:MFS transporter [Streptomyces sp. NPDC002644]